MADVVDLLTYSGHLGGRGYENHPELPPPRCTYAVGDIHGRLDLLHAAVEAIAGHVCDREFRVVFLGDYVDRGPESRGVIEYLIALQQRWPVLCLKGNHEDLMLRALTNPPGNWSRWLDNGGGATLASYGGSEDEPDAVPAEHLAWLSGLPLTTGDRHRIFVHAGLLPGVRPDKQNEQICLWVREPFLTARAESFDAHIVHGHTPVWAGKPDPAAPELLPHRTNLDTGAFATGRLTVGVFEAAKPGGPLQVIKIDGSPMPELMTGHAALPSAAAPGRREASATKRGWL